MSQLELTEEEAAAVLANALRSESEAGRKVSQAELLSIAREAGLSESAVLDQLAQLRDQAPLATTVDADHLGPLPALLPMTPQQAVAMLTETVEVTQMTSAALGLECTLRLGSQKLRARFEPATGGCIVRPIEAGQPVLSPFRVLTILAGLGTLNFLLAFLSDPGPVLAGILAAWIAALILIPLSNFLWKRRAGPFAGTRKEQTRKTLEVIIRAAFGREVFRGDSLQSRLDSED